MKVIYLFGLALLLAACDPSSHKDGADHSHHAARQYTCPMHPQIVSDKPGKCPVCGMDLVEVAAATDEASSTLMLSDTQMRLANVTVQRVGQRQISEALTINGRFAADETRSEVVSSRSAGRLEKLFIKETGRVIEQGEPLYTLYSESLLVLQQEYLLAREQYEALGHSEARYKSFLEASERKLALFGLTKAQIAQLAGHKHPTAEVTFVAPARGVVTTVDAFEGQYVSEGQALYRLENLTSLWVEADLYADEIGLVKEGDPVTIRVNSSDGDLLTMAKVEFLNPEYSRGSQLVKMRASVANKDFKFRPGQPVEVLLNQSGKKAIAVPADAVIHNSQGAHVYVLAGHNSFRPQPVTTGIESFNTIEIVEGLSEGDTLAASGAYLLYSELILKKGVDPMAGHQH